MRRGFSLSTLFIFAGLWAVYCGLGQMLAERFGFLTLEDVIISSRAILATRGDALTLLSLGVPHPPLPFLLTLPFAEIGLKNPAIWMSSFLGAVVCTWFFFWFRRDVARVPILVLLLVVLPILPGVLHSACSGSSGIAVLALLVFSIHLAARFALDQQSLNDLRGEGRLSAWIDTARDQAHAIRFLWAAALLLGLACCAQPGLILALPAFLLVTPLLLPPKERSQWRRIFTIALLLYLPIIAVHIASGVLSGMFDHDFFRGLRPATSSFTHLGGLEPASSHSPLGNAWYLLYGAALTCPPFIYLLIRLRNPAIALLCLIPFFVAWIGISFGDLPTMRAPFTLATLLSIILIFLGARLNRFRRAELAALVVTTTVSTIGAWVFFAASSQSEEHALIRLATGRTNELATFSDERTLAAKLGRAPGVLLDEVEGAAFVAILNDPTPFIFSHEARHRFALSNPQLRATQLLMRADLGSKDAIAGIWPSLGARKTASFREVAHAGPWILLANTSTPTQP
jgi:hypothetical protein